MKFYFISAIFLLFCHNLFSQKTWTLDNAHSNIRFEVGWEDISIRTGEFKIFEGTINTTSKEDLTNAEFYLKVDPNSLDVIAQRLSDQLKGAQFLNVSAFPEIIFKASGAKIESENNYEVKGILKIHGVEKEQVANVILRGSKPGNRGEMLAIETSLVIDRKDFGLEWGSPRLGDKIKVVAYLLYQMRNAE